MSSITLRCTSDIAVSLKGLNVRALNVSWSIRPLIEVKGTPTGAEGADGAEAAAGMAGVKVSVGGEAGGIESAKKSSDSVSTWRTAAAA
jgi:hypothetical protein